MLRNRKCTLKFRSLFIRVVVLAQQARHWTWGRHTNLGLILLDHDSFLLLIYFGHNFYDIGVFERWTCRLVPHNHLEFLFHGLRANAKCCLLAILRRVRGEDLASTCTALKAVLIVGHTPRDRSIRLLGFVWWPITTDKECIIKVTHLIVLFSLRSDDSPTLARMEPIVLLWQEFIATSELLRPTSRSSFIGDNLSSLFPV